MRGVVTFSSVDDNVGGGSPSWIAGSSATPLDQYWGLANQDDLEFGYSTDVLANWADFGGAGIGYPTNTSVANVGGGSIKPGVHTGWSGPARRARRVAYSPAMTAPP